MRKTFLTSEEVKTLCMESLLDRILTRFSGLRSKEVSLKYADNNDWIELPADDLDSFIDMIETAKDSARENLKVIELKICELAQTPQETASHKRLRTSPSPSPKSGSVHVAKKPKHLMARRLEAEFNGQKLQMLLLMNLPLRNCLKNLSKKSRMLNKLLQRNNTRSLSSRVASSRSEVARNCCVRIAIIRGTTKLCVRCTLFFGHDM